MGPDHEHVFVRGTDGNVYQKYWTAAGGWSGWFDIGAPAGGFAAGPATISRNKDVCNVYVRGNDNALWQRPYYNNQWYPWARHNDGGVLSSEPALGSMGPDHEHVFVRGTDGNVYQKYWQFTPEPVGDVSFAVSECAFGWTARYHQSGTHVTIRIQLNPDMGITAETMSTLRTTWRNGILATWANRFDCRATNGGRQGLTFDVQWVTSNAHHVVRVRPGPDRSNMTLWDTSDAGNVVAHEFGHMLGHPDEYADATCPSRNPVGTGTVMDDNTETVARLYNRICAFHGGGHTPIAGAAPEPDENAPELESRMLIDNLKPAPRAQILNHLRAIADAEEVADGAADAEVTFELSGGAPGERYAYRLGVSADGSAHRRVVDELRATVAVGEPLADGGDDVAAMVERDLVTRVFAAARDTGLLGDEAPAFPQQGAELVPDSMIAVITVRDGNAFRRIWVPAGEQADASVVFGAEAADVPLDTPMQLPAESVQALQPLLDALRAVEETL
jgi:hypothetical protein